MDFSKDIPSKSCVMHVQSRLYYRKGLRTMMWRVVRKGVAILANSVPCCHES